MSDITKAELASVRSQIRQLSADGHELSDIRADLVRRSTPDSHIETGIALAGAEMHAEVAANLRRGWAYAIAEVIAAIIICTLLNRPDAPPIGFASFLIALQGVLLLARAVIGSRQLGAWPNGPDPLPSLKLGSEDLMSDDELLERDQYNHRRSRRATRMAAIIAAGVAFAAGVAGNLSVAIFVVVFLAILIPLGIVFHHYEGVPSPRYFRNLWSRRPPVIYAAPRIPDLPAVALADVPRAARLRGWSTLSAVLMTDPGKSSRKHVQGVLYPTALGISFLPDLQSELIESLKIVGGSAAQIVGSSIKFDHLEALLELGAAAAEDDLSATAWLAKSTANRWHVAIPWPDLAQVTFSAKGPYLKLARHRSAGPPAELVFFGQTLELAGKLMSARLRYERDRLVYDRIVAPRLALFQSEVRSALTKVYGAERITQFEPEVIREAQHRLGAWYETQELDTVALFRATLPAYVERHFAQIPEVRRDHADLFRSA